MATATQKVGSPRHRGEASPAHDDAAHFSIFEDNGGRYHWAFVSGDGTMLVRSAGCASHAAARQAAALIRDAFAAPLDLGGSSS